ncbi:ABC transporter ATP-binding protein [Marinitenerispora sediminis]|uniref:Multidrug ABC transporter ATP-binding protein n=1 Tax=Marinitenerispora sediminis TaxID=1931232 RepID=A0A368SYV1_9ACTN|nr:ABC transporter ATP-binding protein [Marinitenerispora sediminis]RCV49967.1 multidrug ABC transporter ATP-binding protein [Marinitenerispora sediminis]RCV51617.1 multidrug ABC transporter ATP-binding protein [Marinitenerispora sediminis]RCV52314.1 multidrug ABC transporter ATP-binding protein [Marinitenerispora sediminis]
MSTAPPPAGTAAIDEPAISVRDLRQTYGDFEAVRGISFDVSPGELFALLGTNGAGKTTTVETLEGFRRPASGAVRVLGLDPYGQPAALRDRVNGVLQHSGMFAELTVAETLDLAHDLAAAPRGRAEVLDMVGLADRADVAVRSLSGGQKRRLDLGLAVLSRPEVLFLDEPTTGMDPEARRGTWSIIGELVAEGVAVLLTTHYLEEAERLADRLAIMHRGRIRVAGTLGGVLDGWGDRIRFRLPADVRTEELPDLPAAAPSVEVRDAVPWVVYTVNGAATADRAHRAMGALLSWADGRGVRLERLELRGASLEEVFLGVADETAADPVGA